GRWVGGCEGGGGGGGGAGADDVDVVDPLAFLHAPPRRRYVGMRGSRIVFRFATAGPLQPPRGFGRVTPWRFRPISSRAPCDAGRAVCRSSPPGARAESRASPGPPSARFGSTRPRFRSASTSRPGLTPPSSCPLPLRSTSRWSVPL